MANPATLQNMFTSTIRRGRGTYGDVGADVDEEGHIDPRIAALKYKVLSDEDAVKEQLEYEEAVRKLKSHKLKPKTAWGSTTQAERNTKQYWKTAASATGTSRPRPQSAGPTRAGIMETTGGLSPSPRQPLSTTTGRDSFSGTADAGRWAGTRPQTAPGPAPAPAQSSAPFIPPAASRDREYVSELEAEVARLRASLEEVRRAVPIGPAAPQPPQPSALEDKMAKLLRDHERNLAVMERLLDEKEAAQRRADELAASAGRRSASGVPSPAAASSPVAAAAPMSNTLDFGDSGGGGDCFMPDDEEPATAAAGDQANPADDIDFVLRTRAKYLDGGPSESKGSVSGQSQRSKSSGRSRQSLTVPQPFVNMETKSGKKGISAMRREQEQREREEAEAAMLRASFKARDVPSTTKEAKYQQLLEEMEARRKLNVAERVQALTEMAQPFAGVLGRQEESAKKWEARKRELEASQADVAECKGQFKANPVPTFVKEGSDSAAAEAKERLREERIKQRAASLMAESKLPPRMELWEKEKGKQRKTTEPQFSFKPAVQAAVPDFDTMHAKWDASLTAARQGKSTTAPKPFSFESEERKKAEEERRAALKAKYDQLAQASTTSGASRPQSATARSAPESLRRSSEAPLARTTAAVEKRAAQTQKLLAERKAKEEAEALEEAERQRRIKETGKLIRSQVQARESDRVKTALHWQAGEEAAKKIKELQVEREREALEKQREFQQRIQAVQAKRPTLFQRADIELQAANAAAAAILTIENSERDLLA